MTDFAMVMTLVRDVPPTPWTPGAVARPAGPRGATRGRRRIDGSVQILRRVGDAGTEEAAQ